jgi:hypothetical protein
MLTQLSTLKTRLALLDTDTTCEALLVAAIKSVSARFDLECNRTLARSVDATYEFTADGNLCSLLSHRDSDEIRTENQRIGRLG